MSVNEIELGITEPFITWTTQGLWEPTKETFLLKNFWHVFCTSSLLEGYELLVWMYSWVCVSSGSYNLMSSVPYTCTSAVHLQDRFIALSFTVSMGWDKELMSKQKDITSSYDSFLNTHWEWGTFVGLQDHRLSSSWTPAIPLPTHHCQQSECTPACSYPVGVVCIILIVIKIIFLTITIWILARWLV